ncbi:hypothetical protein N1F78_15720 [Seonamhaeicola sp. MEBiC1930]|uniref:DUF4870 domain-containing protein n=1 Tax=Seonamhaeicola sp. MEBiC01930 TaxID=2976768 RepID=UPI00324D4A41
MNQQDIKAGKTLGIVAYLTFIGLIISIIMNIEKKNPYISFHIRQMLGLILFLLFSNLTEKYVNSWLGSSLWLVTFVLWVLGIISAFRQDAKPIPFVGDLFQKWFANIGR